MEGAVRVFAGEFNRATLSIQKSDPRGPPFVVTPGNAWCHLMYLTGALTEISENDNMLRCRISDPTGVFEVVIDGMRTELFKMARKIPVPSFLAVVGMAQMYQRKDLYYLSVRPESIQIVDRTVRDTWVVRTADTTLNRLERLATAMRGETIDQECQTVMEHYRTTPEKVQELVGMVESALSSVRMSVTPALPPSNPCELILAIIKEHQGHRGIAVGEVVAFAELQGVPADTATEVIRDLIREDECYQPQKGIIKLL
jgi:RPA family protein